jgi:hypothetical protein
MSKSTYLSGKVCKLVLPAFYAPPGPGAPSLKRIMLDKGELAQICDGSHPIQYIAAIELREGTERGNHYHNFKEEFIYMLDGELLLLIEDIETKETDTVSLCCGDQVFIATKVAHTLRVIKSGWALEFSPARFDPGDTFRYPPLPSG